MNKYKILGILFFFVTATTLQAQNSLVSLQESTRNIASKVLPSVVTIDVSTEVEVKDNRGFFFFKPFGFNPFGRNNDEDENNEENENRSRKYRQEGQGSGFIVRQANDTYYVLTNSHVVEGADNITLVTHDEREIPAKLIGNDPERDLAIVSFKSEETMAVAKTGNSDDLQQGDLVFAIGSPYGLRSSISFGIVSALGRSGGSGSRGRLTDYIQTDAAVNRGNSGGPLLNIDGEVIGINTWIYSRTGDNAGLSFSVPINNALPAVESLIKTGGVNYGWLGVLQQSVRPDVMSSLAADGNGALVSSVIENSPAEKAGVKAGDIIVQVNNQDIEDPDDLVKAIASSKPGSRVSLSVIRDRQRRNLSVILGKRVIESTGKEAVWPGFSVVEITSDVRERFDISSKKGVLVVNIHPNSEARVSGLRAGDIIERVNNEPVNNLRDFYVELGKHDNGKSEILFRVNREGTVLIIGLVNEGNN